MSAWEGSAWQEQQERAKKERDERIARILHDNPSLTRKDAEEWDARTTRLAAPPPKCCPCKSAQRAEVVRAHGVLGPCPCACHKAADR